VIVLPKLVLSVQGLEQVCAAQQLDGGHVGDVVDGDVRGVPNSRVPVRLGRLAEVAEAITETG